MHELIASPFLEDYLVLRWAAPQGVKIPHTHYRTRSVRGGHHRSPPLVE